MAIPSGGGSEVLKRIGIYNQSTTVTALDWAQPVQTAAGKSSGTTAVPANVIITLLTVTHLYGNCQKRLKKNCSIYSHENSAIKWKISFEPPAFKILPASTPQ